MKRIILFGLFSFISGLSNANSEGRLEQIAKTLSGDPIKDYGEIVLSKTSIELAPSENEWELGQCGKDKFTGVKICEIRNNNLTVIKQNGRILVFVVGSDYPNRNAALKIDSNKTFYGREGVFNETSQIVTQLSKGQIAYTRAIKWPYLSPRDNEVDLTGFKDAYEQMLKEYASIR
ncbi:hypothetical protein [Acinetobacter sp. NIPH 298]|uniref:hypothetical protein n=1 Tax=Acinetobacter sp. NIPH 298 TaxID=1217692 RepID=UPI0002CE03F7|nr:hypothetical protein [Acinetobacter sp. NIPH 298]ENW95976.1 hypothetical protein F903_01744 [Acinetobacter sp. NIPH 298]